MRSWPTRNHLAAISGVIGSLLFIVCTYIGFAHYLDPHVAPYGFRSDYLEMLGVFLIAAVPIILRRLVWSVLAAALAILFGIWLFTDWFL